MNQSSKLIVCVLVGLSHFAANTQPQIHVDLKARMVRDFEMLEQTIDAGTKCNIFPILKVVEYFNNRFNDEVDEGWRQELHYIISEIYLVIPNLCPSIYSQYEMRRALQQQYVEIQRIRELRRNRRSSGKA